MIITRGTTIEKLIIEVTAINHRLDEEIESEFFSIDQIKNLTSEKEGLLMTIGFKVWKNSKK